MAEAQKYSITSMLDPFGLWKTYRESMMEGWSKLMINTVNSEDYARLTGMYLDQLLSVTQPVQDAVQKSMTFSLAYLNMPSRDEVVTIAQRLTHIETRLDDLDNDTYEMHDEDRKEFRATERRISKLEEKLAAGDETVAKELRSVDRSLDKLLNTLIGRIDALEAAIHPPREAAVAAPKAEPKPEPKVEPKK
jgi:hypothetical protein